MSRVYLMADTPGATLSDQGGRPVSLGTVPGGGAIGSLAVDFRRHVQSTTLGGRWCTLRQHRKAGKARAWWLVEAESAAAARRCIAAGGSNECRACKGLGECNTGTARVGARGDWYICPQCRGTGKVVGRILASGGKDGAK